jgi:ComF family protein
MLSRIARTTPPFCWPSQCAVCRAWQSQRVCAACQHRFAPPAPRCRRCALRVPGNAGLCGQCLRQPPPFEHAVAAFDYDYPWDGLLAAFKFRNALDLASPLAEQLGHAVEAHAAPRPVLLLPTPLAPARLRERGHNQAWEIARRLSQRLAVPADASLLLRIKDTPHQLSLPQASRAANVHGAFAVEPTRRSELRGKKVAVVDDVMTTGATAAEMARTLLQAGAASVAVWVLARTPMD